jgi:hypothetical protein
MAGAGRKRKGGFEPIDGKKEPFVHWELQRQLSSQSGSFGTPLQAAGMHRPLRARFMK